MISYWFWIISTISILVLPADGRLNNRTFPKGFKFGVATSAYQVEGAWNEDGKGLSNWDFYLHQNPKLVKDGTNADVACDFYHKYEEDIKLLKELGVDFYRFSVAWTRIIPSGNISSGINQAGIDFYNKIIDELLVNNIEPIITIFHWDTPQNLEEVGGWLNKTIVEHYASYAQLLFKLYGDRVKYWLTFNEFSQFCEEGYSLGRKAPFKELSGVGGYQCTHNALIAHSRAYDIYVKEFKDTQKGFIGLSVDTFWAEPKTNDERDILAAEEEILFTYSYYLHPIIFGDYPPTLKSRIDVKSSIQGYNTSRLPKFTEEEVELLKGSYDYIGLNHYTTSLCTWSDIQYQIPSEKDDCGVATSQDPSWKISTSEWLANVPWGFRKLLVWIKENLNNPPLLVTENGWSTDGSIGSDLDRIDYHQKYLSELLTAIHDYGCNVFGYTVWSFMDNFEWCSGYTEKFGLIQVDFSSPNRTRTPRNSFYMYQNVIKNRKLVN